MITGGKWTTYRAMAQDTIDAAIQAHDLNAGSSKTIGLQLQGAEDWSPTLYIRLVQDYGLESEVSPCYCLCSDTSVLEGFDFSLNTIPA